MHLTSSPAVGTPPQVAKANEYVNQGNKALGQAKELQKDTRKWMCCAMMMLLGICLIVVLAVVKPWQARSRLRRRVRVRAPGLGVRVLTCLPPAPSRAQNGIA